MAMIGVMVAGLTLLFAGVGFYNTEKSRPAETSGGSPWEHYDNRRAGWVRMCNRGIGLAVLSVGLLGVARFVKSQATRGPDEAS